MKWLVIALLLIGGAYALSNPSEMNVVVFPDVASTTFSYNFVFSQSSACTSPLLNVSQSITTNSAGRGNATLNITGMIAIPAYLCTYRTGILVDTQSLNPNAFEKNIVTAVGNWSLDKPAIYTNITTLQTFSNEVYANVTGLQTANATQLTFNTNIYTNTTALQNAIAAQYANITGLQTANATQLTLNTQFYNNITGLQSANATANTRLNGLDASVISIGNWTLDKPLYNFYNNITGLQTANATQLTFNANIYTNTTAFTMANVIARLGRPAIVFAPNKTLAAQLYSEFRDFFPNNAVSPLAHHFVIAAAMVKGLRHR